MSLNMWHVVFFTTAVVLLTYSSKFVKQYKVILACSCFIMIAVSGLRHGYIDTRAYRQGFEALDITTAFQISNLFGGGNRAPGFQILSGVIRLFTDEGQVFLFIMALITVSLLFWGIVKNVPEAWLGVFLFIATGCYVDTMNGVRQYLVSAVLFYLTPKLIEKRQAVKYCAVVLIMSTVHYTALIFLPLYFVCQIRAWSRGTWYLIWAGLGIVLFFNLGVGEAIVFFLENLSSGYLADDYSQMILEASTSTNIIRPFVAMAPLFLAFLSRRMNTKVFSRYNIFFNMSIINAIIWLLSIRVLYFYRLCMYFTPFMIVQLCWEVKYFRGTVQSRKLLYAGTVVLYFAFFIYSMYTIGDSFFVGYFKY